MALLGTDVKDEDLEVIRLLEAEEAISAYVEQKIADLLEKVSAGKSFLDALLQDKGKFRQKIVVALRYLKMIFP